MGHSMGGGGTWHLGMKYPEIWAALAPLAPAAPDNIADLKKIKDKPVIMVMGASDFLWRSGLPWVTEMERLKMNYKYIEVKNGGHLLSVIQKVPEVFAFFEKHRRKPLKKP
jgi:predicted peptidase